MFHTVLLKPFCKSDRFQPLNIVQEGEETGLFNVESILQERLVKRGRRKPRSDFLVKWEGYGTEHNSWEPEHNLGKYVPQLIAEYRDSKATLPEEMSE